MLLLSYKENKGKEKVSVRDKKRKREETKKRGGALNQVTATTDYMPTYMFLHIYGLSVCCCLSPLPRIQPTNTWYFLFLSLLLFEKI